MSRHNAMHRPPRLSQVDVADFDDEAVTCSARESRVALAGLPMTPRRSSPSLIEDSDVEAEDFATFGTLKAFVERLAG